MAGTRPTGRRLVAVYPDLQSARGAMTTLEGRGVDARNIRLLGDTARQAGDATDVSGRDRGVKTHVGRRVGLAVAIGAVAGALIGLVVSLIIGNAIPLLVGTVFGAFLGFPIGGYATLDATDEWELTFEPETDGQVAVAVQAPDDADLDKATATLRECGALRVDRR